MARVGGAFLGGRGQLSPAHGGSGSPWGGGRHGSGSPWAVVAPSLWGCEGAAQRVGALDTPLPCLRGEGQTQLAWVAQAGFGHQAQLEPRMVPRLVPSPRWAPSCILRAARRTQEPLSLLAGGTVCSSVTGSVTPETSCAAWGHWHGQGWDRNTDMGSRGRGTSELKSGHGSLLVSSQSL